MGVSWSSPKWNSFQIDYNLEAFQSVFTNQCWHRWKLSFVNFTFYPLNVTRQEMNWIHFENKLEKYIETQRTNRIELNFSFLSFEFATFYIGHSLKLLCHLKRWNEMDFVDWGLRRWAEILCHIACMYGFHLHDLISCECSLNFKLILSTQHTVILAIVLQSLMSPAGI